MIHSSILQLLHERRGMAALAAAFFLSVVLSAQTLPNAVPAPTPEVQFFGPNGLPLAGGKLYTYAAGTTTPQATYTDSTAGTPNANPIILDSAGRASIWIGANAYKFILQDQFSVLQWTQDNVADTTLNFVTYVKTVGTATLISYTPPGTGAVQTTVSAKLAQTLNVIDYGAVCNDSLTTPGHDDTAGIQAALNNTPALNGTGFSQVLLPAGMCRVTAPIVIGRYSNLRGVGNATKIHCDYQNWVGTDYNCVKLMAVDSPPAGFNTQNGMFGRIFGDFTIIGTGNSGIVSTGLYVGMNPALAPIQFSSIVNYAVLGTRIQNLYVEQFDLGIQLCEANSLVFDNVLTNLTRVGISINGQAVNVTFKVFIQNLYNHTTAPGTPFTSSNADTVGFFADSNQGAFPGRYLNPDMSVNLTGWPQGTTIVDSLIYGGANDLVVNQCFQFTVLNNIIDGATKDAVVLTGPTGFKLEHNYVFTSGTANNNVFVAPVYLAGFDDLKIIDNWLIQNHGLTSGNGIYFAPGSGSPIPWAGVNISLNRITGAAVPINLGGGITQSAVSKNFGNGNGGIFCLWDIAGSQSVFDGNTSTDNYGMALFDATVATQVTVGINASVAGVTTPTQLTPNVLGALWRNSAVTVANPSGTVAVDLGWADAIAGQLQAYKLSTTTNGLQLLAQQGASLLSLLNLQPNATQSKSALYGSGDASGVQYLNIGFKDHEGVTIAAVKQSATKTGLQFYAENPLNTPLAVAEVDPTLGAWSFDNPIHVTTRTVSTLTSAITCNTGNEGYMAPVTDANSSTFNAALAGGGSNHVIGYCNGTGWVVH